MSRASEDTGMKFKPQPPGGPPPTAQHVSGLISSTSQLCLSCQSAESSETPSLEPWKHRSASHAARCSDPGEGPCVPQPPAQLLRHSCSGTLRRMRPTASLTKSSSFAGSTKFESAEADDPHGHNVYSLTPIQSGDNPVTGQAQIKKQPSFLPPIAGAAPMVSYPTHLQPGQSGKNAPRPPRLPPAIQTNQKPIPPGTLSILQLVSPPERTTRRRTTTGDEPYAGDDGPGALTDDMDLEPKHWKETRRLRLSDSAMAFPKFTPLPPVVGAQGC